MGHLESNLVGAVQTRANEVTRMVAQPLRKVYAITEQLQSIEFHLSDLRIAVREQEADLPSTQELSGTYSRLSSKLEVVSNRLLEIENRARERAAQGGRGSFLGSIPPGARSSSGPSRSSGTSATNS